MTIGLFLTALTLGLRHGVDWDHIAAISDLNGTAKNRRHGFALSMTYAIGHGAVVFALGTLAILFGLAIPDGFDVWMGRVVGVTLILLGGWILFELARRGRDFRLRSRWMLVIDGTFAGMRRVRNGLTGRSIAIEHDHDHDHDEATADHSILDNRDIDLTDSRSVHDHAHIGSTNARIHAPLEAEPVAAASGSATGWRSWRERAHHGHSHSHSHNHSHELLLPDSPEASYGHGTATGIGMLHGVGIESPTQIAIFVAASAVTGVGFGLVLLGAWVLGLIIANAVLALIAGAGLLSAERSFPVYATLAVVISILSIALGTLYLFDLNLLPALS